MPHSKKGIRVSGPAERDLAKIGAYTQKEWGKRQKTKYLADIKNKFCELRDTPGMGTDMNEIQKGLRSHPTGKHVVYYRETKSSLVVVRVLHQSMDLERHLARDQELSR